MEKSIEEREAELDKEFYDEFIKLVIKYQRDFNPVIQVMRLTPDLVNKLKENVFKNTT